MYQLLTDFYIFFTVENRIKFSTTTIVGLVFLTSSLVPHYLKKLMYGGLFTSKHSGC